ncbi:hypothetical protein BGZ61DRAFT_117864 [Ilyonectria robusta]|uniref:uncharacterized protein n=1 Tax=Ilyonectria robusta TaxID=1079257 RepID=UPI001E8CC3D3|nr:uncharacterized protein BGZ61DRAFT_117864 [Ilyonectria robusta]KAH8667693.1 hypothetical protein BGZ61DRAFT_117864 [Ilyonectria robusta]
MAVNATITTVVFALQVDVLVSWPFPLLSVPYPSLIIRPLSSVPYHPSLIIRPLSSVPYHPFHPLIICPHPVIRSSLPSLFRILGR